MSILFHEPWFTPPSSTGGTLPGSKLYFYQTGTSTLQSIYTDSARSVEHTNPVIADASGRFDAIYLKPSNISYKVVLTDADDVTQKTIDPYNLSTILTFTETSRTSTSTDFIDDNGDTVVVDVIDSVVFSNANGDILTLNFTNP